METALTLPEEQQFRTDIEAINRFQQIVHSNLITGQDYGVIPGTGTKPTLLKPGAEKIAKLLKLADYYDIIDKQEQWDSGDKFPLFRYLIKCKLVYMPTGEVVSEGLGECNSYEAKYRWRETKRQCPVCGSEAIIKGKAEWGGGWLCYKNKGGCGTKFLDGDPKITKQQTGRTENEDIHTQINTILKMAKKRALVDAALSAGRLSNIFTQDLDDMKDVEPPLEPQPNPNPAEAPESIKKDHFCTVHNQPFTEIRKGDKSWYSHKTSDGKWCNEKTPDDEPLFETNSQ